MEKTTKKNARSIFAFGAFLLSISLPLCASQAVEDNPAIPEIISRAEWGADESIRYDSGGDLIWPFEYVKLEKFIVHHTASSKLVEDTDGSGEYKSMVKNISHYHTVTNGWGDIGYNYLIDPNGNIYEGRAGGNGVVGGHSAQVIDNVVTNFNKGSVGISIIGNYQDGEKGQTNTELSEDVKTSLEKLIGWVATNNGIDLSEVSNFLGRSIDGVVGHKDVDWTKWNTSATSCPGTVIYEKLDGVQDEAIEYADAYDDYIYQVKGDSAFYMISGGYKSKFSSRDDMPSSYQDRELQYISRAQLNAYQYKDMKILPDGTLIQQDSEGTVYYIDDEKKRPLGMTEEQFLRLGFKSAEVVSISEAEMELYDTGDLIKYGPDGKLVKGTDSNVYFVENGKKRRFTSATLFTKLGYSWSRISADAEIGYYLEGDVMRYPTGTLLRSINSSSVYYIETGNKRLITSGALFERLGFKWSNILAVEGTELNWYPSAGNMIYPDKTLVRGAGTPTVYLVEGGKKREITSATLLYKLGYDFANVVEISAENLSDYPTGAKAVYPDGTLVKAIDSPAVYRINAGTRQEFTSLGVFEANGAKWGNIVEISKDEVDLYPLNGIVRYPDGTLLRADGGDRVYVIKGGSAVWVKTAEEFIAAGYKWSNIRVISPAEMALYVLPVTTVPVDEEEDDTDTDVPAEEEEPSNDTDTETETGEPDVRVSITSSTGSPVSITANGNYKVEYRRGSGEIYKAVEKKSGETVETAFFSGDDYIRFVPASESVIMEITSYVDLSWDKKVNDNRFRGVLEIRYSATSKTMWVIEEVPLEGYLRGISEATIYANDEYLKAFSMVTRSYALYHVQKGGKHSGEPFHLKNGRGGNGNDQQYRGYNLEMRSSRTAAAYRNTAGIVIEYLDKPILAAYSSDSGGVTKSGCDLWGYCSDAFDYLDGGVKDPENTVHDADDVAESHKVGMSAAGAYQMAVNGSGYLDIVRHYYPGVNVEEYY